MSGDKKRPRTERRERERAARELVKARQKLAALEPGGNRGRPIEVASSSVIDLRAESLPCPLCDGRYRILDHRADSAALRALTVECRLCGVQRVLWFQIRPALAN